MGYIPSSFKSNNNLKIVMSEEVYTRLAGCINLCGLDMGKGLHEFGTVLYGNVDENGTIYLEIPSKWDNYKLKSKSFSLSDEMLGEMLDNMEQKHYQVVCHVHTHPYFQGDFNRHYSQSDIDFYRELSTRFKGAIALGCMLSVSGNNVSNQDDISFAMVDPRTNKIYNISDISVNINGQSIPLRKQQDVYVDQNTGQHYPVQRTMFEVDEALINTSRSIRR